MESPIKEPTPAQRHVQTSSKPAFPFHNGARFTDPSQTQSQAYTQSVQSDSGAINESSASFDVSQYRYGVGQLSTSTMLKHQVPYIDLRREALERDRERPPRVLVPDSDVSGGASQQGHSQSQSQSQSQPKVSSQSQDGTSRPFLTSQPHNTDTTDAQHQTGQMLGNRSSSAKAPSLLGPRAKEITVGQNGEYELTRSLSTSQTQTDSLRSIDDPFFDRQRFKPVDKQRKSSPPHEQPSQNRRDSRTHEGTLEDDDKGFEISHEDNEVPIVMDVDDARTHAMLLDSTHRRLDRDETSPGTSHLHPSSKDKQFTIKGRVGSPHPKGEHQYTSVSLSPSCSQQPSPSAHLGKRPRSSSISFQQSSPPISEGARKRNITTSSAPLRKKARRPPPEDKYAVQRVEHEPEAWHTARFMQLPAKKHPLPIRTEESRPSSSSQAQSLPQDPGSNSFVGRKSISADLSIEDHSREVQPSTSKLTSTSPSLGTGSHRAAAAEPLKKPVKKSTSLQREPVRKLSGDEARTLASPVLGSTLSYSNGKVVVDFTLRRELGAPQWINWSDVERNLLKIGRLRHKEAEVPKNTK